MTGPLHLRLCMIVVGLGLIHGPAQPRVQAAIPEGSGSSPAVDFSRQVLPILSDNCFACHGPDARARKGKLRLDTREGAFAALRSGGFALVPGKPEESNLLDRITSEDRRTVMPPTKSGKHLSAEQKDVIRRWISQGAHWTAHWAFQAPTRPALPRVSDPWLGKERDRSFHPGEAGCGGAQALARSGPLHAVATGEPRPDRPAAHAG